LKRFLIFGLVLSVVFGVLATVNAAKDPETLVYVTFAGWDSFDPAWIYDTASGNIVFHIYETLLGWEGASTEKMRPVLATEVPSVENGLIKLNEDGTATCRVPLRTDVHFQNGEKMVAEDVVYSFQRNMLADPVAGPDWMLINPLLGYDVLDDVITDMGEDGAYDAVMQAVYVPADDPNAVEFYFINGYSPFWLAILSENCSWSAIVDKSWCIEQGAWDGKKDNWMDWHDRAKEEMALYLKTNGTGPYMLEAADPVEGFTLVRYDNYWGKDIYGLPYFKRIEGVYVEEWTTRRLMLEQGDGDIVEIPIQYKDQVEGTPGVRTIWNLPAATNGGFLLNLDPVIEGNDRLGSGQLDGNGIPPDFFLDVHVRKGFTYAFDYQTYIDQVMMGEAVIPTSCVPAVVPFHNPNLPGFSFDLEKAAEELKLAFDGELWEKGFFMRLDYNAGNEPRKTGCEMLRDNIQSLNPKFRIEVRGIPWANYLDDNRARRLTMFFIGWLWDYPDASNYVFPYLHSLGTFGGRASFGLLDVSDHIDDLIAQGVKELDPAKRQPIYYELQQIGYDEALYLLTNEATGRRWMRTDIGGFQYNATWSRFNWKAMYRAPDATIDTEFLKPFEGIYVLEEW
jgi:peptide/nickel transport system substrate-binding protein